MALTVTKSPENIRLVEDHMVFLKLVRQIAESSGYTLKAATSAKRAALLQEEHLGTIGLLPGDVRMRGMAGAELAIVFRSRHPEIRVALRSG